MSFTRWSIGLSAINNDACFLAYNRRARQAGIQINFRPHPHAHPSPQKMTDEDDDEDEKESIYITIPPSTVSTCPVM
jgi:hypothetical protein